jgi:hypothetical protein
VKRDARELWSAGLAMLMVACAVSGCTGAASVPAPEPRGPDTGEAPSAPPAVVLDSESIEVQARLMPCDGLAGRARRVIHLGAYQDVELLQVDADDEIGVVVATGAVRPGESPTCVQLHERAGAAPAHGTFWPGTGSSEARILMARECGPEFCPVAVVVRRDGEALGGVVVATRCDRGVELEALRWFEGQDSLKLVCRHSMGAAHRERVIIVHGIGHGIGHDSGHGAGRGLQPVLEVETGERELASLEERETPGFCERRPVGWVRLIQGGARPLVRVLDPSRGEAGYDGKGKALRAEFRFHAGAGRFEQVGDGELVDYDARAWCN